MKNQLSLLNDVPEGEYGHETPFRWGKYQGVMMRDIPAKYLLDLYNGNKIAGPLLKYVHANIKRLKEEHNPKLKQ